MREKVSAKRRKTVSHLKTSNRYYYPQNPRLLRDALKEIFHFVRQQNFTKN